MPLNRTAPLDLPLLGSILLLALALRLPVLNWPLWYDEILTLDTHLRLPWGRMMDGYSMNHHYLYSFEAKALTGRLGDAPWVQRLPALIAGLAGIATTWALARRVGGTGVAHISAALLAVSFHHIWFSTNARGYTQIALLCTVALALFLSAASTIGRFPPGQGIEKKASPLALSSDARVPRPQPPPLSRSGLAESPFVFALIVALAIFTHLTAAVFVFALGLVWAGVLVTRRFPAPLLRWGLIGFGFGAALTLLAYAPVLASLHHTVANVGESTARSAVPQYGNPLWTMAEAARTTLAGDGAITAMAALAVVLLCVLGGWRGGGLARLFGVIVLVHIVATLILLRLIGMRIWPRFFFLDIGFLMILLTIGAREAARLVATWLAPRTAPALFGLAVVAMLGGSLVLALRNYAAPKQNLAGAIAAAAQLQRPGEPVMPWAMPARHSSGTIMRLGGGS